jgi:DNA polymerase III epsilon subunit-like protein
MSSFKFRLDDPDATITSLRQNRGKQELSLEDVAGCGMTFNAVDVETADSDRSTICQIGIAHVVNGQIDDRWSTLVDPEFLQRKSGVTETGWHIEIWNATRLAL